MTNNNEYFDFAVIADKYHTVLSDYIYNPTFEDSSLSYWNSEHEREFLFFDDYSSELYNLRKIKDESDCLKGLEQCLTTQYQIENFLRVEMQKFVVEMIKVGMDPKDVLHLCEVYPYWGRYYHVFAHVKFDMYSPRAHFISLLVQELELNTLYREKLHLELLDALHFSQNDRRQYFIEIVLEKRKLMSEDLNFYLRVQKEIPELPLGMKIQKKYLDSVIDRIKMITPTKGEIMIDKYKEKLFYEGINKAVGNQVRKEREQQLEDEMELRKMENEINQQLQKDSEKEAYSKWVQEIKREMKEDLEEWKKKNSKKNKNS